MQYALEAATVSSALIARIRKMVDVGELKAGERINEVRLAEQLGVSRTPLREALNRLVSTSILEARPRYGCFVPALTAHELRHVYGMRPILDCAALALAGAPDGRRLEELEALNNRFKTAKAADRRIDLDDAFHLMLIERCGNPVLLDLIRAMMDRTRRYEIAYLSENKHVAQSGDEHDRILRALQAGDLDRAVAALKDNLTSGLAPMTAWLESRPKSK